MFRNLTIFRATGIDAIADAPAHQHMFQPCLRTDERSIGWTPPRGIEHGALVETVGDHMILTATIERKRVPGDALRRAVEERCKAIEQQEGFKPGRSRKKELKDEIRMEMLVHAIPTRTAIRVWVDREAGTVAIDSASAVCDDIVAMLIRSFDGLQLKYLTTAGDPIQTMTRWLAVDGELNRFTIGRDADLVSFGGASVRLRDRDLTGEHVISLLRRGMRPTRIELFHSQAGFVLSPLLQLRRIRIELPETPREEGDDPFDADVTISCAALRSVISDLLQEFGGLKAENASPRQ